VGDIVSFGGERATQCYIVGTKEGSLVLTVNRDKLGSGYLTIPLDVAMHIDDVLLFYSNVLGKIQFSFIAISQDDATVRRIFRTKSKVLTPATKFWYDCVQDELVVKFKGVNYNFSMSVTQAEIESQLLVGAVAKFCEFKWYKDQDPSVSYIELKKKISLATGDIVLGGSRGEDCYFVTEDRQLYLHNDDELMENGITIPHRITKHIENAIKFYSKLVKDKQFKKHKSIIGLVLDRNDVTVRGIFKDPSAILDRCRFVYDTTSSRLVVTYHTARSKNEFSFPLATVTQASIETAMLNKVPIVSSSPWPKLRPSPSPPRPLASSKPGFLKVLSKWLNI
jgi:hypothetical protein